MILRTATLSDLDAIMRIEEASFIPEIQEDREVFKKRIEVCPSCFLVFEFEGRVGGYLSAEFMDHIPLAADELKLGHFPAPAESNDVKNQFIYISSFALLPEFRGGGNGRKMWNEALKYFRNKFSPTGFLLLVNELWGGAKHIYSESGFETISIFENFFPCDGEGFSNGILMKNLLK